MVDRRRKRRAETENIYIKRSLGKHRWLVNGSRGYDYTVDLDAMSCECPDWQKEQPSGGCKHIIYVKMNHSSATQGPTSHRNSSSGRSLDEFLSEDTPDDTRSEDHYEDTDWSGVAPKNWPEAVANSTVSETTAPSDPSSSTDDNAVAAMKPQEGSATTDDDHKQATDLESQGDEPGMLGLLLGGIILSAVLYLPFEILLTVLNISAGTVVSRYGMIFLIIETLVILGYLSDSDPTENNSSETDEVSETDSSSDKATSAGTDSSNGTASSRPDYSGDTDSSNQISDEAWRRKQDQGSPNQYRGPGRY